MKKILVIIALLVVAVAWYFWRGDNSQSSNTPDPSPTTTTQVVKTPYIYVVERGEGLWHVATKELGSGDRWMEIAEANKLSSPYVLTVGQELTIPGKETEVTSEVATTYTLEEVQAHDNAEDCWLVIDGRVYDVTSYVASGFHPGKAAILMGCGRDATEMFNNRPNDSGSHSARARSMLPKYYIGDLK